MSDATIPIIEQIEGWVKDVPGWSPVDQLYTLFNLVYLSRELQGDIVEVGSWCGRSTVVLGAAARLIGDTRVFSIDLFPEKKDWRQNPDGSYSFEVKIEGRTYGAYKSQTVWKEPFEQEVAPIYRRHDGILDIFNETVARNNLQQVVKACKGNSALFARSVEKQFKCKLIFIDGDHGYDAVLQDVRNLEPYLVEGGWICFDDAFSSYEGVNRAITESIIQNPAYELCQQMTRKCFIARKRRRVPSRPGRRAD